MSAIGMVALFQYINFIYLKLFNTKDLDGFSYMASYSLIEDKIKEYN
jgi:hypothetical protein